MADIEVLADSEVSLDTLEQLFKRAFFNTSRDSDGDLVVQGDGPRVIVLLDDEKQMVKFLAMYGLKDNAPLQLKHTLVNKMNDDVIFVRFSVPEQRSDMLVADYYLPYEGGISAFQIINAMRLFSRVVPGAIRVCDELDLVE